MRRSPGPHKSSCASAVVGGTPNSDDDNLRKLAGLIRPAKCNLRFRAADGCTNVAATGMVHPLADGALSHSVPIEPGFMRCHVDSVVPEYQETPLHQINEVEDHHVLRDVEMTYTVWPV